MTIFSLVQNERASLISVALYQFSPTEDLTSALWKYFQLLTHHYLIALPKVAQVKYFKGSHSVCSSGIRICLQFHFNSAWLPTSCPHILTGNLMNRAAGKAFGLLNRWSFFDAHQDAKISNSSFSEVGRFFCTVSIFRRSVWWHFLYRWSEQTLSALFFIIIAFFWSSVSWGNSELEGFVPNWNGMKFQNPPSKWKTFPLSRTLFVVGCPFCSQRGARLYYDCVLSCVFNLDVKLGLAWN